MAAKYILGVLAIIFLVATLRGLARDGGRLHPQGRTWLLIAAIFGMVSVWLFVRA